MLNSPYFLIIATQILFTSGDLLARYNMASGGFNLANFLKVWFLVYMVIRQIATFAQLYIFSSMQLGKSMAMFGAISICISNLLGFLLLGEVLSMRSYVGISLAILAFIALALMD